MGDSKILMFKEAGKLLVISLDGGLRKEKSDMEGYTIRDGHKIHKLFNWMVTIILFIKQKLIYQLMANMN